MAMTKPMNSPWDEPGTWRYKSPPLVSHSLSQADLTAAGGSFTTDESYFDIRRVNREILIRITCPDDDATWSVTLEEQNGQNGEWIGIVTYTQADKDIAPRHYASPRLKYRLKVTAFAEGAEGNPLVLHMSQGE